MSEKFKFNVKKALFVAGLAAVTPGTGITQTIKEAPPSEIDSSSQDSIPFESFYDLALEKYDSTSSPFLNDKISLDDVNAFEEVFDKYKIPKAQATWSPTNRAYYDRGYQYARKSDFDPNNFLLPEKATITQMRYYFDGIKKAWLVTQKNGVLHTVKVKEKLTKAEKNRLIKQGEKRELDTLKSRASKCTIGLDQLRQYTARRRQR